MTTDTGRDPASLPRRNSANGYRDAQLRAADAAVTVLTRAAFDPAAVGAALGRLDETELRLVATTLALVADHDLTLRQLSERVHGVFADYACHPALWGTSWTSKSEHGTRSRYNAGCRGDACRKADTIYRSEGRRPPAAAPPELEPYAGDDRPQLVVVAGS